MRVAFFALAASASLLASSSLQPAAAQSPLRPPGEGVMCALGIYSFLEEMGARCVAAPDPAVQAGLHAAVADLDHFVLANGWTPADLARFKDEQARIGHSKQDVCLAEWLPAYEKLRAVDMDKLRSTVQALVARPGKPTWGDCL